MVARGPDRDSPQIDIATLVSMAEFMTSIPARYLHLPQVAQIFQARRAMERHDVEERKDKQQKRELARAEQIAAWDAKKVNVGGVEMTNAEHLRALRGVNENADYYADWAVRKGLIDSSRKEQFKDTGKRLEELKELRRANGGQLPDHLRHEEQQLENSREGRAIQLAAGDRHKNRNVELDKNAQHAATLRSQKVDVQHAQSALGEYDDSRSPHAPAASARDYLPAMPDAKTHFSAAASEDLTAPAVPPPEPEQAPSSTRLASAQPLANSLSF